MTTDQTAPPGPPLTDEDFADLQQATHGLSLALQAAPTSDPAYEGAKGLRDNMLSFMQGHGKVQPEQIHDEETTPWMRNPGIQTAMGIGDAGLRMVEGQSPGITLSRAAGVGAPLPQQTYGQMGQQAWSAAKQGVKQFGSDLASDDPRTSARAWTNAALTMAPFAGGEPMPPPTEPGLMARGAARVLSGIAGDNPQGTIKRGMNAIASRLVPPTSAADENMMLGKNIPGLTRVAPPPPPTTRTTDPVEYFRQAARQGPGVSGYTPVTPQADPLQQTGPSGFRTTGAPSVPVNQGAPPRAPMTDDEVLANLGAKPITPQDAPVQSATDQIGHVNVPEATGTIRQQPMPTTGPGDVPPTTAQSSGDLVPTIEQLRRSMGGDPDMLANIQRSMQQQYGTAVGEPAGLSPEDAAAVSRKSDAAIVQNAARGEGVVGNAPAAEPQSTADLDRATGTGEASPTPDEINAEQDKPPTPSATPVMPPQPPAGSNPLPQQDWPTLIANARKNGANDLQIQVGLVKEFGLQPPQAAKLVSDNPPAPVSTAPVPAPQAKAPRRGKAVSQGVEPPAPAAPVQPTASDRTPPLLSPEQFSTMMRLGIEQGDNPQVMATHLANAGYTPDQIKQMIESLPMEEQQAIAQLADRRFLVSSNEALGKIVNRFEGMSPEQLKQRYFEILDRQQQSAENMNANIKPWAREDPNMDIDASGTTKRTGVAWGGNKGLAYRAKGRMDDDIRIQNELEFMMQKRGIDPKQVADEWQQQVMDAVPDWMKP